MAIWTGADHDAEFRQAAEQWKARCLLSDGSVFSREKLWTKENFQKLRVVFVDNPIEGSRKFFDKLQEQIGKGDPLVCKLAAEVLWSLYLFVSSSSIAIDLKRKRVAALWSLSGETDLTSDLLKDEILRGIAGPGIAFLAKVWAEYGFHITLLESWKSLPVETQQELLKARPWEFCSWVSQHDGSQVRAYRHMLLNICYPNEFERICSRNHKKEIYAAFANKLTSDDFYKNDQSLCALDRSILSIRRSLEKEYGSEQLDFYRPPLRSLWMKDDAPEEVAGDTEDTDEPSAFRYWIEKTIVKGRQDRSSGSHKLGSALWSPQRSVSGQDIYSNMRAVKPGDVVLHLTDNIGITGISVVDSNVDENFLGVPNTEWGEQPSLRVQLRDFKRLDPPLERNAFFGDDEIRKLLLAIAQSPKQYGPLFYNKALELKQGAYLTEAPPELIAVLAKAYKKSTGQDFPLSENAAVEQKPEIFSADDAIEELFIDLEEVERILGVWRVKKNVILQGAPGTGKSFTARSLAFALMGEADVSRLDFVQFHQSYSYEDFVQGFRPVEQGFELKGGRFYEFCRRAEKDLNRRYVFIIDEINRGNLSRIFGELMLLIEADKRSPQWQMPLAYGKANDKFFVPENVYLLGLMNTADRSLAVVDYALRRRFAFFEMQPQFLSEKFAANLKVLGISNSLIKIIRDRIGELNKSIEEESSSLGKGFRIGHSFFCSMRDKEATENLWYRQIIETEIVPLLEEYWFDNPDSISKWREFLLANI